MSDFNFRFPSEQVRGGTVGVRIIRCGEEVCRAEKHPVGGTREYYSLHFVRSGRGCLTYGNGAETAVLTAGDIFLLYPGEQVEYRQDSTFPWSYSWIDFDGDSLDELMAACGLSRRHPVSHLSHPERVRPLLSGLLDAFEARGEEDLSCMGGFLMIISELMHERKQTGGSGAPSGSTMGKLRRALIYIDVNFSLPLHVEEIARAALISVDYLQHLFNGYVGMSVTSYINRLRVSLACEWLHEPSRLPISQIAHVVGFEDERYFARTFRRYTGMTARQYRALESVGDPFAWMEELGLDYHGYHAHTERPGASVPSAGDLKK